MTLLLLAALAHDFPCKTCHTPTEGPPRFERDETAACRSCHDGTIAPDKQGPHEALPCRDCHDTHAGEVRTSCAECHER